MCFSNKKIRTPPNFFIMNLAVSDFLMAITQSPIFFVNSLYKGWIFGETGILVTFNYYSVDTNSKTIFFMYLSMLNHLKYSANLCLCHLNWMQTFNRFFIVSEFYLCVMLVLIWAGVWLVKINVSRNAGNRIIALCFVVCLTPVILSSFGIKPIPNFVYMNSMKIAIWSPEQSYYLCNVIHRLPNKKTKKTLVKGIPSSFLFSTGCKMYAFCGALFGIASMINLLTISVDRYIVITKPLQAIQWTSKRRTCLYIALVWLYSLAWSLAPLLGWSKWLILSPPYFFHSFRSNNSFESLSLFFFPPQGSYIPEGLMTSCTWDYVTSTPANKSYTLMLCCFVFFIPLGIISYCYLCMFLAIRHASRWVN